MAAAVSALPPLADGETVTVAAVAVRAARTRPPQRFSEGTLIQAMKGAAAYVQDREFARMLRQVSGLGTAATRDSIIEALKQHAYLLREGRHLVPSNKAQALVEYLERTCPLLVDPATTAQWEAQLDLVAQRGGGAQFVQDLHQLLTALVTTLKSAATSASGSPSSAPAMTTPTEVRPPTENQLAFARSIAQRKGLVLPPEAEQDGRACSAWIDANKGNASPPSDKQLAFARSIAQRKGLVLPPEAEQDSRACSAWIDANK